jgi:ParB-like chromosome segregation protein Spo0J
MAKPLEYREIPVNQIVVRDEFRSCRGSTDSKGEAYYSLVSSIELYGQIEPIGVMQWPSDNFNARNTYAVLYGFRRFDALQSLAKLNPDGINIAKVLVYDRADVPDPTAVQIIQSVTTEPIRGADLALALASLDRRYRLLGYEGAAKRLGISQVYAAMLLRIAYSGSAELLARWSTDTSPLPISVVEQIVHDWPVAGINGEVVDKQLWEYELAHSNAIRETPDDDIAKRLDDLLNALDDMQETASGIKDAFQSRASADTSELLERIKELESLDSSNQDIIVRTRAAFADHRKFLIQLRSDLSTDKRQDLIAAIDSELKRRPF